MNILSDFSNPCMHEGRCIAIDATLFKCICHTGYTGTNCDVVNCELYHFIVSKYIQYFVLRYTQNWYII